MPRKGTTADPLDSKRSMTAALRRMEMAMSLNAELERELKHLRVMAQCVHHRDYVGAEAAYDKWERYRANPGQTKRVYTTQFKYHVVQQYKRAGHGRKVDICKFFRLEQALVIKWAAAFDRDGVDGLEARGQTQCSPVLRGPLPPVGVPDATKPPPKEKEKPLVHIYIPTNEFEEI